VTVRPVLLGIAGVAMFFAIAQLWTATSSLSPDDLPRAITVVDRVGTLLADPAFRGDVAATLLGWACGVGLAAIIGVPVGIAFGLSPVIYRSSATVVDMMRSIPGVAIIPLALLVLGEGLAMKIALVAYATIWPIIFNSQYGVHDVDPLAVQTARVFGLPPSARLLRVVLPSAAPYIFTGLRIAVSIGLIVVVGAELLAGTGDGIGSFILTASLSQGQIPTVMAGAAVAGLFGVAINLLFEGIERRLFAWREAATA
jgi:NitT/TauT family transport system permease protein